MMAKLEWTLITDNKTRIKCFILLIQFTVIDMINNLGLNSKTPEKILAADTVISI